MRKRKDDVLTNLPPHVWQGRNGYWYTKITDSAGGVKLVRKKDLDELLCIIEALKGNINPLVKQKTVNEVFEEWIEYKLSDDDLSDNSALRYRQEYNRTFSGIRDKPISEVTEEMIQDYAKRQVIDLGLSRKAYSEMRTVFFGVFKFAFRKKYSDIDIKRAFDRVDIPKKRFKSTRKKAEQEVFNDIETHKLFEYLKSIDKPVELGILFMFGTGVRVGELAAITWSDISEGCVFIHRTETRIPKESGSGYEYKIRPFPKTEAGERMIPIPSKYLFILERMKVLNPDGEYLFSEKGKRIDTFTFRRHLYNACDRVGIPRRSPHKVRKTYASILLDNDVSEKMVTEMMGHTSINVTNLHYARSRRTVDVNRAILDRVSEL